MIFGPHGSFDLSDLSFSGIEWPYGAPQLLERDREMFARRTEGAMQRRTRLVRSATGNALKSVEGVGSPAREAAEDWKRVAKSTGRTVGVAELVHTIGTKCIQGQ